MPLPAFTRPESLSPDAAVVLGTVGLCLGFLEFNRPGRILPGALGLLLFLLACASFAAHPIQPSAAVLLACATAVLIANAWIRLPLWLLVAATVALIISLRLLTPSNGPHAVHTATALLCGTLLGFLSSTLTRLAFRARRSKALN